MKIASIQAHPYSFKGNKTIAVASDHGGFNLKSKVVEHLKEKGYKVNDIGCDSVKSCNYPDFAHNVAQKVTKGEADLGILVCGTGIGMSIAANKHEGIRASAVENAFSAKATKAHNDSNILCLGERVLGDGVALDIVDNWLNTEFEGGRHQNRIDLIEPKNFFLAV